MNAADPLANLHPLRDPASVSWWPPAPGWWVLTALLLAAILGLAIWGLRRHRRNAYRREALRRLEQLQAAAPQPHAEALNRLLKEVALTAFPREQVAALSGASWIAFLNASCPKPGPSFDAGFADIYVRDSAEKFDDLPVAAARHWISHHEAAL